MMTSSLMAYTDYYDHNSDERERCSRQTRNSSVSSRDASSLHSHCTNDDTLETIAPECDVEADTGILMNEEQWDCVSSDDMCGEEDVFWPPPPNVNPQEWGVSRQVQESNTPCASGDSSGQGLGSTSHASSISRARAESSEEYRLPNLLFSSRHSRSVNWNLGSIFKSFQRRNSDSDRASPNRAASETPSPPKENRGNAFVIESEADNNADIIDIIDNKLEHGIITPEEHKHLLRVIQGYEADIKGMSVESHQGDQSFEEVLLDVSLVQSEHDETSAANASMWTRLKRVSTMFSAPQYEDVGTLPPSQSSTSPVDPNRQHPNGFITV